MAFSGGVDSSLLLHTAVATLGTSRVLACHVRTALQPQRTVADVGELLARVESVLRRTGAPAQKLQIGDVTIDPESRQVWKAGEPVELTVKEFNLLLELVRHKNVALSRASLYEIVWQEEYTGETRTLDSHIQRLRRKLDWNDRIQTVFRIGYRLEVRR